MLAATQGTEDEHIQSRHTLEPAATEEMWYSSKLQRIMVQDGRQRTAGLHDLRAFGPYVVTNAVDSGIASVSVGGALVCNFDADHLAHKHLNCVRKQT
jgi:hypothetical protein